MRSYRNIKDITPDHPAFDELEAAGLITVCFSTLWHDDDNKRQIPLPFPWRWFYKPLKNRAIRIIKKYK